MNPLSSLEYIMATTNIYVLRLQGGCWYIGKSANPAKRFEEHLRGEGSAWTQLHKPITCERVISNVSAFDEDKYTKEYMAKYGIDKVRGGTYVASELDEEQIASLQKEIWGAQDKCTRCGRVGHFVKDCFATSDCNGCEIIDDYVYECEKCNKEFETEKECEKHVASCKRKDTYVNSSSGCYRCGRTGHYANDCYAKKHAKGYSIDDSDSDESYTKSTDKCFKCGRKGHYASDCYANTTYSYR
jgi:predicted GIY-YIG superfamily endonuclease